MSQLFLQLVVAAEFKPNQIFFPSNPSEELIVFSLYILIDVRKH